METPINKRLEILLTCFKINQKQLAEKAGLSENTISNAKKGKNVPGVDFFNAIYRAFPHINPQWLYMGVGNVFMDGTSPEVTPDSNSIKDPLSESTKIISALRKEIQYLQAQIRDKEEIINLLRSKIEN
jgi:transcriptional regulator with XRE-family HTH domain